MSEEGKPRSGTPTTPIKHTDILLYLFPPPHGVADLQPLLLVIETTLAFE